LHNEPKESALNNFWIYGVCLMLRLQLTFALLIQDGNQEGTNVWQLQNAVNDNGVAFAEEAPCDLTHHEEAAYYDSWGVLVDHSLLITFEVQFKSTVQGWLTWTSLWWYLHRLQSWFSLVHHSLCYWLLFFFLIVTWWFLSLFLNGGHCANSERWDLETFGFHITKLTFMSAWGVLESLHGRPHGSWLRILGWRSRLALKLLSLT